MPTIAFTAGNDSYVVNTAGIFALDFLDGADILTVQHASATVSATMGWATTLSA